MAYGAYNAANGPSAPAYQPLNVNDVENQSVAMDQKAYALSDANFKANHGNIVQAENNFENQTLKQTQGGTLTPALQSEYMRAGLGGALGSFGDVGTQITPGSAASSDVARNLGQDIMGFQQQQTGLETSMLGTSEALAPRRTFGLSGQNVANMLTNQNAAENSQAQQQYVTASNANAAESAAMMQAGGSIMGGAMGGAMGGKGGQGSLGGPASGLSYGPNIGSTTSGGGTIEGYYGGQPVATPGGTASSGLCCFIFLEAYNGTLPTSVRAIRDLAVTPRRNRGYRRQARWLVPEMQKHGLARWLTNWLMIKPLTRFGEWFTGNDSYGWVFFPFVAAWFAFWSATGKEQERVK